MVGIRLIIIMAIVGGLIAYIADKMGMKIGKKKMSVFGLRPKHTSILLTVLSGMIISVVTITIMAMALQSARTALFGMEKIQKELKLLNEEKLMAADALYKAKFKVEQQNKKIASLDAKIQESTIANDEMETELADMNSKYLLAQNEVLRLLMRRNSWPAKLTSCRNRQRTCARASSICVKASSTTVLERFFTPAFCVLG